ncbi:MAG TPA: hypothetical protein VE620_06705 [Myxococcales bacterium]|jgi:hypothetical protein|nr:hypothetical protein [Myxococcales bacterium]
MKPPMRLDSTLADTEVKDTENRAVRLGTLWADRPAVLVWVRHFG